MQRFLRTLLTGADNNSYDIIRLMAFVGGIAMIVFEGIAIWHGVVFDPVSFSSGFSILAFGHGVSLKLKSDTEPDAK